MNSFRLFSATSADEGPTRNCRMIPPTPILSISATFSATVAGEPQIRLCSVTLRAGADRVEVRTTVHNDVLDHRLLYRPEAEIEGIGVADVLRDVLRQVEVPR